MFLLFVVAASIILLVISVYFLISWLIIQHRVICPTCGLRSMKHITLIRASVNVGGRRTGDSWSYYLCSSCGAKYKHHRQQWLLASDQEWS